MELDRRQFLAAGGFALASCRSPTDPPAGRSGRLDLLLAAHADARPENGGGANHYPMAAEALAAMGHETAIADSWIEGVSLYSGELPRRARVDDPATCLGSHDRFGDLLDCFRRELARQPWRAVVAHWAPRLAPGLAAATFHGLIRTAHAVRALRGHDTPARRNELAAGLAYWTARYVELPARDRAAGAPGRDAPSLASELQALEHPWLADRAEVGFHGVMQRLTAAAVAPPLRLPPRERAPAAELAEIVREAATGFLEMLVLERHRMWLLHTVTGPAAVGLLLPEVDDAGARRLVASARQAVVALYAAYGEPFTPRANVRESTPPWPAMIRRAVDSGSIHGAKLIETLSRFDVDGDPVWRSVAAQWFEWV